MLRNAVVRPPGATFAQGLTTGTSGAPNLEKALEQHGRYCDALRSAGLTVTTLEADARHPDSTFVEDTAVLTDRVVILTRPGAESRRGEVSSIREALSGFYASFQSITPPGTVDGGDICAADRHVFIGVSRRTNQEGARQLAGFLAQEGFTSSYVDIRGLGAILHLKSGVAYLGDNRLILIEALADRDVFGGYDVVRIDASETYAANCVRVNDCVLIAEGYPEILKAVRRLGARVIPLEMSEFRKMDGGLSCLSLRF
jgi:dimethylargininase